MKACSLVPGLARVLGQAISRHGNVPLVLGSWNNAALVSFPVKPVSERRLEDGGNVVRHMRKVILAGLVPGWACVASLGLIARSARLLVQMADREGWRSVVMPLPGCGAGELEWETVSGVLEPLLDHRFAVITWGRGEPSAPSGKEPA